MCESKTKASVSTCSAMERRSQRSANSCASTRTTARRSYETRPAPSSSSSTRSHPSTIMTNGTQPNRSLVHSLASRGALGQIWFGVSLLLLLPSPPRPFPIPPFYPLLSFPSLPHVLKRQVFSGVLKIQDCHRHT